jgi:hypothetical protein
LLVLALLSASILLYQFLQPAIGGKGQFLKASCHREGPGKPLWRGFSWIRLQWIHGDQKFPRDWGNRMLSWIRCESKARWKAPIKRKRKEKSEVGVGENNAEWTLRGWNLPEQLDFDSPLKISAWGKDDLGFGSERRPRWIARRKNRCWTDLTWRRRCLQSISE